jgi:hypothetical protein
MGNLNPSFPHKTQFFLPLLCLASPLLLRWEPCLHSLYRVILAFLISVSITPLAIVHIPFFRACRWPLHPWCPFFLLFDDPLLLISQRDRPGLEFLYDHESGVICLELLLSCVFVRLFLVYFFWSLLHVRQNCVLGLVFYQSPCVYFALLHR